MTTIGDIINELVRIKNVADDIEVKGKDNASKVCYICDKCDDLIKTLDRTAQEIQNESKKEPQNETILTEVGEENGEQNRDSA